MFESSVLFWLVLGILGLIAACLLLMAYEMARRDGARTRELSRAESECSFYFGFLSRHGLDKPIPYECFGCVLALACVKAEEPKSKVANTKEKKAEAAQLQK